MKSPTSLASARAPKTFSIQVAGEAGQGQKFCFYGKSGIGKSTLGSMAPRPVYISIDDGARQLRNPLTGEPIAMIGGVSSFLDIRDALHQKDLFEDRDTVLIDTWTRVEEPAMDHILDTVKKEGKRVESFRHFGWDGDRHMLDHYRILLSDLDALVRQGKHVILLAQLGQITVSNAEGANYLEDGPKLQHRNDCSVRTQTVEWCDHVFRIGYLEFAVQKDNIKSKVGKVVSDDATRAIFTGGAPHFVAKSRPVTINRAEPYRIPSLIPFSDAADNSLYQYLFDGAVAPEDAA